MNLARRWHRSPVLWFALPVLIFLGWSWVHSMHRTSTLDFTFGSRDVRIQNDGAALRIDWQAPTPARALFFPPSHSTAVSWEVEPRSTRATIEWFPLPSYLGDPAIVGRGQHYLDLPYWLLILAHLGLWQLPWLIRHFRRKRIDSAMPRPL